MKDLNCRKQNKMAPYKRSIEYINYCTSCNTDKVVMCCDECGDSVCKNNKCCTLYGQYKKTDIVLCKYCITEIEDKFKLYDYSKETKYRYILSC